MKPDILYISRERAAVLTDTHVRGAPDLVVEILSPGTRKTDEVLKRQLYERFGVQEYWVIGATRPDLRVVLEVRHHGHANPIRHVAPFFHGHQHDRGFAPFELSTPPQAGLWPADPGVVDLDVAVQGLADGTHHRAAQLRSASRSRRSTQVVTGSRSSLA